MKPRLFHTIFVASMLLFACQTRIPDQNVALASPPPPRPSLPTWFTQARVHLHSDDNVIKVSRQPGVAEVVRRLAAIETSVLTMRLDNPRDPGWSPDDARQIGAFIAALHQSKIHFMAYSNLLYVKANAEQARQNPLVAKSSDGQPVEYPLAAGVEKGYTSYYLDLTDPAVQQKVIDRLLELGSLGADGFLLDGTHMPVQGAFGSHLEKNYRGSRPGPYNAGNPTTMAYIKYQSQALVQVFGTFIAAVKARYPNMVFIVSARTYASVMNYTDSSDFVAMIDSAKSEYRYPVHPPLNYNLFQKEKDLVQPPNDVMLALGWSYLRDSAEGRPPHIWSGTFQTGEQMLTFAQSLVAYGAIANLNLDSKRMLVDQASFERTAPLYRETLHFGKVVAPYLPGPPNRYAAVLISANARDERNGDFRSAWNDVIGPSVAVFEALLREGIPVATLNDQQVDASHLQGLKLLFVPNAAELTPSQTAALQNFQGKLVDGVAPDWSISGYSPGLVASLRPRLRALCADAPLLLAPGLKGRVQLVFYPDPARKRALVAVLNDFGWLAVPRGKPLIPPAPATGVSFLTRLKITRATDLLSGQPVPFKGSTVAPGTVAGAIFVILETAP